MPASIIGGATYHLRISAAITTIPVTAQHRKVGTATAVNPDLTIVVSPCAAFHASSIAALLYQTYTAAISIDLT